MSQFPTPAARKLRVFFAFAAILLAATFICAQDTKPVAKPDAPDGVARLRIEVTAGDQNKPVADASVYVKFSEDRKIWKDRKYELSLKTNEQGVARSPEIPMGKTLIQVISPGWKTFGQWYEINQPEQTVAIHLVRPVRPY